MKLASTGGVLPQSYPTENLWHELKDYLRGTIKPKGKQELIDGILPFGKVWMNTNVAST